MCSSYWVLKQFLTNFEEGSVWVQILWRTWMCAKATSTLSVCLSVDETYPTFSSWHWLQLISYWSFESYMSFRPFSGWFSLLMQIISGQRLAILDWWPTGEQTCLPWRVPHRSPAGYVCVHPCWKKSTSSRLDWCKHDQRLKTTDKSYFWICFILSTIFSWQAIRKSVFVFKTIRDGYTGRWDASESHLNQFPSRHRHKLTRLRFA